MTRHLFCLLLLGLCLTPVGGDEEIEKRAMRRQRFVSAAVKRVLPTYAFIGGGGSGVIISADGYILTNDHVAGSSWVHRIRTMDGKSRVADLIGTDPRGDVALLKVRDLGQEKLPFLPMGDANALKVGEMVIAIGNPFGMGNVDEKPTVTIGIVSTLHRFQNNYTDAIMTDAPINPGNSGGPMISMSGKLVGINGQMVTRFGVRANSGIGYAITINQIQRFMSQLKSANGGYVRHGLIRGLGLPQPQDNVRPPRVRGVRDGSTADKSGFQTGDEIVEVDGQKITTVTRFVGVLGTYPAGSVLPVQVRRQGKSVTLKAKLDPMPMTRDGRDRSSLRVSLSGASFVGGSAAQSLTVVELTEGGPAAKAKVRTGDKLFSIAGMPIAAILRQTRNPKILDEIVAGRSARMGSLLELTVVRKGKQVPLVLDLVSGTKALGVKLGKISADTELKGKKRQKRDLTIVELVEGCGLYRAGLRRGDVLTGLAGVELVKFSDYMQAAQKLRPGGTSKVEYRRGGQVRTVEVVVDLFRSK